MPTAFRPMKELPPLSGYGPKDTLVIFGEVFTRGYVNGLIEEAESRGMKVIYSTVGRREKDLSLRPLLPQEISEKAQKPLINVPLEAGFDLESDSTVRRPIDYLAGIKLSEWQNVKLDFARIEEARQAGVERFRRHVKEWCLQLNEFISGKGHVIFAHIMAGGIPRTKIVMPLMNRIFKGYDDRFASSEEFWNTDIGKLCAISFQEVTAETFLHLIELTKPLREKTEEQGNRVSYLAYGYHGTEMFRLRNGKSDYQWQSYAPYLQGFAKLRLEEIAQQQMRKNISACVFNAPEILTNSSSVFQGVEVPLYALLGALQAEGPNHPLTKRVWESCRSLLKPEHTPEEILRLTSNFLDTDVIRKWTNYEAWPQHNGPEQMRMLLETSDKIKAMHADEKNLMTAKLSEIVFQSCGRIMLNESWDVRQPVWWIGHDMVARSAIGEK